MVILNKRRRRQSSSLPWNQTPSSKGGRNHGKTQFWNHCVIADSGKIPHWTLNSCVSIAGRTQYLQPQVSPHKLFSNSNDYNDHFTGRTGRHPWTKGSQCTPSTGQPDIALPLTWCWGHAVTQAAFLPQQRSQGLTEQQNGEPKPTAILQRACAPQHF